MAKCTMELERIWGIRQGSAGGTGANQYNKWQMNWGRNMNIKKWNGKFKEMRYKSMKKFSLDMIKYKDNIIVSSKEALKNVEPFDWNFEYKPGNVLLSLKEGFKEIKAHKDGKHKLKSLKESEKLWKKE